MDNKPRPKPDQGSSWNDENERMTNPNRRQDEDKSVESQQGGQHASRSDQGSPESPSTDRSDSEQLHSDRNRESDSARRSRQTDE